MTKGIFVTVIPPRSPTYKKCYHPNVVKVVLTLEMLDGRRHTGRASGWRKLSELECSPLLSLCQPDGHAGDHCDSDDDHCDI